MIEFFLLSIGLLSKTLELAARACMAIKITATLLVVVPFLLMFLLMLLLPVLCKSGISLDNVYDK